MAEHLVPQDTFYTNVAYYDAWQTAKSVIYPIFIFSLLGVLLIGFYGFLTIGKTSKDSKIVLSKWDKVPFEIQLGMMSIGFFGLYAVFYMIIINKWNFLSVNGSLYSTSLGLKKWMALYGVDLLAMGLGTPFVVSLVKHLKNGTFLQNVWSLKCLKKFYSDVFTEEHLEGVLLGTTVVYCSYQAACFLTIINRGSLVWVVLRCIGRLAKILIAVGIFKWIRDYIKIAKITANIAKGYGEQKISLTYSLPIMQRMAIHLNSISEGITEAVQQGIKSERLKTELITNVSHDLKTPLTSIISYIDLLKNEEITNETAKDYIKILDERSYRLKRLIEDLIEASKAMTGNIKPNLRTIDLSELITQSAGEHEDRFKKAHLEIKMSCPKEIMVKLDGKLMERVLDNLFSNVSKYALPATRVYIEVIQKENQIHLTIKNISKAPLDGLAIEDFTERFMRGEKSRTTEGSGLGLSIAQSLVSLQGGTLQLYCDGDLFKVEVILPLLSLE